VQKIVQKIVELFVLWIFLNFFFNKTEDKKEDSVAKLFFAKLSPFCSLNLFKKNSEKFIKQKFPYFFHIFCISFSTPNFFFRNPAEIPQKSRRNPAEIPQKSRRNPATYYLLFVNLPDVTRRVLERTLCYFLCFFLYRLFYSSRTLKSPALAILSLF